MPYVDIKAFEKGIVERYTDGDKSVLCDEGEVIIVWDGARCGYVGKAIKGALGSTLALIRPKPNLTKEYLYYYLKSRFTIFNTQVKGMGIPHLNPFIIHHSSFIIPPLPEQHRIVAKIEELFSDLDDGITSLKKAREQLKVYRQSVLKWAFEGRLTNEDVKDGELPEGWKWKRLSSLAVINPKLPFSNIHDNIEVTFLPMKLVEEEKNLIHLTEVRRYKEVKKGFTPMTDGDVIFAKITPCMENGKIAVIHSLVNKIAFGSTEFHVIRCSNVLNNNYLFYYLVQERIRKTAQQEMTGAVGQKRVPKRVLEEVDIPHCTFDEQTCIVHEIESRFSVADNLEQSINESLQQAEALRQSILKRAFEGKLVNND